MSKKKAVQRPNRDPDYYSKRDVPYWWAPEWVRGTGREFVYDKPSNEPNELTKESGEFCIPPSSYGRIHPVKEKTGEVHLYMKGKDGKLTFIQGSIQREFHKWHEDRQIDYILLGMDPDEILATED